MIDIQITRVMREYRVWLVLPDQAFDRLRDVEQCDRVHAIVGKFAECNVLHSQYRSGLPCGGPPCFQMCLLQG